MTAVPEESMGRRNDLAARLGSTDPILFLLAREATWIRIDTTFHQIDSPNRTSVYRGTLETHKSIPPVNQIDSHNPASIVLVLYGYIKLFEIDTGIDMNRYPPSQNAPKCYPNEVQFPEPAIYILSLIHI